MFWKTTSASAAFVAVLADTFTGAAAGPIFATRDEPAPAASSPVVLQPAPIPGENFSGYNDPSLSSSDNFYWAQQEQGILANMTLSVANGFRLLNSHRFGDIVEAVDCSNADVTIKFNSADNLNAAKNAWTWVNNKPENTVVYVVDGSSCGGQNQRQPYYVNSISYDEKSNSATLEASTAKWQDFADDATIRLHGLPADGETAKRGWTSINKDVSINVAHDFGGHIYSTVYNGINIGIDCTDCKTTGTIEADITLSFSNGFQATMTAHNSFGFRFAVGLSASGAIHSPWASQSFRVATVPLAGISISDVVELGPEITFDVQASISDLTAAFNTNFGIAMTLPEGSQMTLGQSANLNPSFSKIGPSISGSVSTSARLAPLATLSMAGTFMGKGLVGGLSLNAPILTANVKAAGNSAGGVCPNGGTTGVAYSVNVGMEVDAFGGFGSISDQPHKTALYTKNAPIVNDCVRITGK
ncbi:hypothetical protein PT974_12546 [Cladobotryum mycophilum]|uniref:Uncharacterized protein n=1 Tax=Cladobotryum mycophilum TaxID=491253 RepID=A0ABR0S895_9HYPO